MEVWTQRTSLRMGHYTLTALLGLDYQWYQNHHLLLAALVEYIQSLCLTQMKDLLKRMLAYMILTALSVYPEVGLQTLI